MRLKGHQFDCRCLKQCVYASFLFEVSLQFVVNNAQFQVLFLLAEALAIPFSLGECCRELEFLHYKRYYVDT
jgi:hypothetical protein